MKDRKVILYIAVSLDGFIARENGSVDWLDPFNDAGTDYGYAAFLAGVDVVMMGRTTYEQVLGFGEWPYAGKECLIFSHRPLAPDGNVRQASGSPTRVVESVRQQPGGSLWLVGGADLIEWFDREDLIDELVLSIMPVTLGKGIPLFRNAMPDRRYRLERTETFGDVVQCTYGRNEPGAR